MNALDYTKRQIIASVASRTLDRAGVRNETREYSSQELYSMLEHVAAAAIELWNGQIQAEIHLIQTDCSNRIQFARLQASSIDPAILEQIAGSWEQVKDVTGIARTEDGEPKK